MRATFALLVLAAACTTTADPSATARVTDDTEPQHALGATTHLGVHMTAAIRTCRDACWRDIPFDECARQRDACFNDATTVADTPASIALPRCRKVAHACRRLRRECLQGCWTNAAATQPQLLDPSSGS